MNQVSSQDSFKTLLSFLKTESLNWLAVLFHVPSLASKEKQEEFLIVRATMTKVMESGIFTHGELLGYTGSGPYPVPDLAQFIYELSYRMLMYEKVDTMAEYPQKIQEHFFFEGVRHLKLFLTGVREFKGKRVANKFKTMLNRLKNLEEEILTEPDKPRNISKAELKKEILDIFCEHINAPKDIIADWSAVLLNAFQIPATHEGMRDLLKKK
jgi:hypothetical protein